MKFSYVVLNSLGKTKKGTTDAASLREATQLLIDQGWYIKKITPYGKLKTGFREFNFGGISLVERALLVKHLSTMLKSGINLTEALEVIVNQSNSKSFRKIISQILEKVKTGQGLANTFAQFPKIFDPLFINIIRVGEESGTLEGNLEYLANELEDRLELRRNIKAASFYPAIILSATFGLGIVLAYFVLPKISHLFKTLSFELPWSTKLLLWLAAVMDKYGLIIILGLIGAIILLRVLIAQNFFKPIWHWLVIKMPIIGQVVINYNLVMINRTLGILLKSGLTIDRGIEIVTQTTRNVVYQKRLKEVFPQIQKGKRLADALADLNQSRRKPLFPLLAIKMISVGERSGRLSESFEYLAEYFEKEVNNMTKNLTTILEPVLLIVVGLIVGFVAISVISPIYQITGQLKK